jgi:sugar phosphate isomerase/epimerase
MRLGVPILETYRNPEEWVELVLREGYGAAYCPVEVGAPPEEVDLYAAAADEAGIVIAEVGAWGSNPLSSDPKEVTRSLEYCKQALALAERIGARCCVNIAGSPGPVWAGPAAENYTEDTFVRIVESVQEIIDAVKPTRAYYTLEIMPWIAPEDLDEYVKLIESVDRERFAVHFDPANLVNDARKYYATGELITNFVRELGPFIRSCHAKDIVIDEEFPPWTVRLFESRPGTGNLDWRILLTELATLDRDLPLMLEHLETAEEYRLGAEHIREAASLAGVEWVAAGAGADPAS